MLCRSLKGARLCGSSFVLPSDLFVLLVDMRQLPGSEASATATRAWHVLCCHKGHVKLCSSLCSEGEQRDRVGSGWLPRFQFVPLVSVQPCLLAVSPVGRDALIHREMHRRAPRSCAPGLILLVNGYSLSLTELLPSRLNSDTPGSPLHIHLASPSA